MPSIDMAAHTITYGLCTVPENPKSDHKSENGLKGFKIGNF